MDDKIAIVLVNKNGEYKFKLVTKIINDKNVIEVANSDYNKMLNGEPVSIKGVDINTNDTIELVFNKKSMYDAAIKMGLDETQAEKIIVDTLNSIGSNIDSIDVQAIEDMVSLEIKMINSKEKTREETDDSEKYKINVNEIKPDEIIEDIKKKVIAQDDTVETVVLNIFNNQLVLEEGDKDTIETEKTSILLDGPTGTGKTLIMKEVAAKMNLPIVIKPATMYATTGYRGVELQDMLISLLKATNGDLEAAERGIVVLDEIDKLGNTNDKDSSLEIRKAVQQDLLTYIGGSKFTVEYKGKTYDFDTSRLTFICLGAFTDMREKKEQTLDKDGNYEISEEDYIKAGIMRELVGRFQLITSTKALSKADYIRILKESSISPISKLVELGSQIYRAAIVFDESIIDEIATMAVEKNTGARALNSVVNSIRNLILKDLYDSRKTPELTEIRITHEMLEKVKKQSLRKSTKKENQSKIVEFPSQLEMRMAA